jgi:Xaa-Pro aminopeptidase
MTEVNEKVDRLARLAHANDLAGVLLTLQPNFTWLTGGRSNRIDGSRDAGAGSLFVTAQGARYVLANSIEIPRLQDEALSGLEFTPVEYPWIADHQDPPGAITAARTIVGSAPIGADAVMPGVVTVATAVVAARAPLTDPEVERYRRLGHDVAHALEAWCRGLQPGIPEAEIARQVTATIGRTGARAIVTLIAADERIARYRHPVPTDAPWRNTLLIAVCAERQGLVVALSRIVTAGPPARTLIDRTTATAKVFGALLSATQPGTTGADLYRTAVAAYEDVGFAGEELRHHQGGATGYRSRDWVAHPASRDRVQQVQAFAWNPSITGTKVEDTALVLRDRIELITATADWPAIEFPARAGGMRAAGILML